MNDQELNRRVAHLLYDWECDHDFGFSNYRKLSDTCYKCSKPLPDYANDLNAAWKCVIYINKKPATLEQFNIFYDSFKSIDNIFWPDYGEHPARAICLAFVEAMENGR